MEELSVTTTFRRSQHSTWSSDLEVECKSLLRPSLVRPSLLMLNHLTQSKTSRPRFKIRKVSHPINRDSSLQASSFRMAAALGRATGAFQRRSTLHLVLRLRGGGWDEKLRDGVHVPRSARMCKTLSDQHC